MEGIAKNFGLPFVGLGGKPLTFGYKRAAKRMGESIKNCAIVGDQLLTDILGGNLAGCKTILVGSINSQENLPTKFVRALERSTIRH